MTRQTGGLFGGALAFGLILLLPAPEGMSPLAQRAAAVTVLMAVWWMTEAIPIAATAFVPAALFPLLGILGAKATAANYGHNYVLMFLAGFFIARAFEVHQLHKRIALTLIDRIGTSRRRIVLSFMIATSLLSMWIANVAVTLLMLPIGMAVAARDDGKGGRFGLALMLAIAYSASIGGTGSLVGTPPNMVFVGMVQTMYPEAPAVTFVDWMEIGVPFVLVMLPITWLFLTRTFGVKGSFTGSDDVITTELEALGPMQPGEKRVLGIFVCTGLGWIFRDVWATSLGVDHLVHDTTVAVLAALMLFMTFITEINSNTATASIFLPVLATMAAAGHMHPFLLMISATFACFCAFMLPSGTGPNAVIFGSGHVTIPQMSRAGLRVNFISVAVLSLVMVLFAIPLLGISGTPPSWATMP